MTLPLEILNRLHQGQELAANVTPRHPDRLAWVYVYPFLDPAEAIWLSGRLYRTGSGHPIRGYLVRYVEADREVVEAFHRSDQDDLSRTVTDVIVEVTSEEELALALGRWMTDFTALCDARKAGYWFASGAQLTSSRTRDEWERKREYRESWLQPRILAEIRHLASLPESSTTHEELRRQLMQLTESWRRAVHAEEGWHQRISSGTAARLLGIDEPGLMRLIDWGLLTACYFPEHVQRDGQPLVLLGGEIGCLLDGESTPDDEPLPAEEIWWRGLVDLDPECSPEAHPPITSG